MTNNIIISSVLHLFLIIITALSLPFLAKKPIDLPPIVSVELIQISNKTNIPYAPKARKIIEETKDLISRYGPNLPILETIGYRESKGVLNNTLTIDEAIELTTIKTIQFAKRQKTWVRNKNNPIWLNNKNLLKDAIIKIESFLG